jgi:hypothetical protein
MSQYACNLNDATASRVHRATKYMRQRNPQNLDPVLAEIVMCGLEVVERDAREVGKGLAALIAFTQGVREGE